MARRKYENPQLDMTPMIDVVFELIIFLIGPGGMVYNGRGVTVKELDRNIKQAAAIDKKTTVLLQCTLNSPHKFLVDALDTCAKYGLKNLSIFSM